MNSGASDERSETDGMSGGDEPSGCRTLARGTALKADARARSRWGTKRGGSACEAHRALADAAFVTETTSRAVEEVPVLLEQSAVDPVDKVQDVVDVRVVQSDSCRPLPKGQYGERDDQRNVADADAKRLV